MSVIIRNRRQVDPLMKDLSISAGCTIETIKLNILRLLPVIEDLYGSQLLLNKFRSLHSSED